MTNSLRFAGAGFPLAMILDPTPTGLPSSPPTGAPEGTSPGPLCSHPPGRWRGRGWARGLLVGLWLAVGWLVMTPAAQAQWTLLGSPITGEAEGDQAGYSVSLSSDGLTLALGAIANSSSRGQVKVYKLVGGVWTLQGSPITGDADGDQAGWSVSLSSDGLTLALGAPNNSSFQGQVKVYKLVDGAWTLQGRPILGEAEYNFAGTSVSLSSDGLTLALGAPLNSPDRGQVKVFKLVGGEWTLQGRPILGDGGSSRAGTSVSLSSDGLTLALGAPYYNSLRGYVKVYKLVDGEWTLQGRPILGEASSNEAGASVSLSSDGLTLALGAPGNSSSRGQVKVYKLVDGEWTLQGRPILGEAENDVAGWSVSLSSDGLTLALGAVGNSSSRGQVKVYKLVDGEWTLQDSPFTGEAEGDQAGYSVSLSSDGLTLALGAPYNSSSRGQVKVYRLCSFSVSITPSSLSLCPGTSLTLTASAGADTYAWSTGQTTPAITVSPTSLTPYSLTATSAGGVCSATATTTVTVHPSVVASLSPSSSTLTCAATSVTLTAGGGVSYGFSPGAAPLSSPDQALISSPGLYSVTVTAASGCTAVASTSIGLNSAFVALAGASSSTALVGTIVSLSASGGTAYQWAAPVGTFLSTPPTDPVVSAGLLSSGVQTFTVVVTNGPLCSQSLTVSVTAISPPSVVADLTPTLFARPSIVYGSSALTVVVNLAELNNQTTATPVILKLTKDAKVSLSFPASATTVGGRPVQNSGWSFDPTTPGYYTLTSLGPIPAGGLLSVGLEGLLSPGSTVGALSISATVSSGDGRRVNNVDADRIEYFPQ